MIDVLKRRLGKFGPNYRAFIIMFVRGYLCQVGLVRHLKFFNPFCLREEPIGTVEIRTNRSCRASLYGMTPWTVMSLLNHINGNIFGWVNFACENLWMSHSMSQLEIDCLSFSTIDKLFRREVSKRTQRQLKFWTITWRFKHLTRWMTSRPTALQL